MKGRRFWKMSGSGNDFVFFDVREEGPGVLETAAAIGALCERRSGIGADGVVFIDRHPTFAFAMRYYNRDGSLAEMCGNAALCSARLAREIGIVGAGEFTFETSSGPVTARFVDGLPEIDMIAVAELSPSFDVPLAEGERQIGYSRVGVPHLVVEVDDIERVDVSSRGRVLRNLPSLPAGANANFVSRSGDGDAWEMRTYERGVEAETLACGTGAVASAALLASWGLAGESTVIRTRSGCDLTVSAPSGASGRPPILRGEGRIVFEGALGEIALPGGQADGRTGGRAGKDASVP